MSSKKRKQGFLFKIIKGIIGLFYKKYELLGQENIPSEPCIFIGNHAKAHGPIITELYLSSHATTWCIGEMLSTKEAPAYMFKDFWSNKPKRTHWFYKIVARVLSPLIVYVFKNIYPIAVYHDIRVMKTFKATVEQMAEGRNMVIFPEYHLEYNDIVNDFQQNFVDVARLYYKKTGKALSFVPTYYAPYLKKVVFGKPVEFNPNIPIEEQRGAICDCLKNEITALAKELPAHKVVPYENLPKRKYKLSK